ncbi:major tail protein [Priestia flexa]|uniref:major tail protein n=1 Tax=Priestia flexa TaxID=86664 RepID=UPI00240DBFF2|nr:major tail protein [Priestia flexa]WEZ09579.1 phage tail protein [Priestia flexa]
MADKKNYRSATGVDEFYYAILDETGVNLITGDINFIDYLQTIEVEMPQEAVRAYGANKVAEIAVAAGNISVSSAFHTLPIEDRVRLLGLESTASGLHSYGGSDNPPYVACVFAQTYQDGSKEWVGLPKGLFLRPNISGQTKEDGVEFQPSEITAEFMDRDVEGFSDEKSVIFGKDGKGETAVRDELFQAIFGTGYPTNTP